MSACKESLYSELGLKRVNYLHYLANLSEDAMLYKVFLYQWKFPVKGDWVLEAKKNLEELDIDLSLEDLRQKFAYSFKRLVKTKTKEYTLQSSVMVMRKWTTYSIQI